MIESFFYLSSYLSVFAVILFLIAFVIYNIYLLRKTSRPNIVSWCLFALVALINSFSYFFMTHDFVKSAVAFTNLFICMVTVILVFFKGERHKVALNEKIIVMFCLIAIVSWKLFNSATCANLLLQPAYILAFFPTILGVYKNPNNERPLPWFLWACSLFVSLIVIAIRWEGAWKDFLNPSIAFFFHFFIGALSLRKASA
ncbi:hypothetical protein KA107_03220 [Candidatus Pacearchaeota archaeon]|nr:hypothetical protein [Candidatus Pacearchaeota archaeon]